MKKIYGFLIVSLVLASCSATKDAGIPRTEVVKSAVETKRFIIKFDRLYSNYGSFFDLVPRSNYIIVDGERAILSAAYIGRQFSAKPIAGFNMRGYSQDYELTSKPNKGSYNIKLDVNNGKSTTFHVYITVSKNGYCSASVSALNTDNVRYSGYLVPISKPNPGEKQDETSTSTDMTI